MPSLRVFPQRIRAQARRLQLGEICRALPVRGGVARTVCVFHELMCWRLTPEAKRLQYRTLIAIALIKHVHLMNASGQRHIAWTSLIGCVLAQALAGVWHPHLHAPRGDGQCSAARCERPAHACGHRHSHDKADRESQGQHAPCQSGEPHDEPDCCVCRFLALQWLATPLVQHSSLSDLATPFQSHLPQNPYVAPRYAQPSRGPPAV